MSISPQAAGIAGKRRFAWFCFVYAAVMLYASTIVGPIGVNFVSQDPVAVFHRFLAIRFVAHGSDQRADWIGNLLLLVPFGFSVTGTLSPKRGAMWLPALIGALLICLLTILTIKYLQLFFPPRTVTLNYVTAQAAGAVIGCVGFVVWRHRIMGSVRQHPLAALVMALWLYFGALVVFLLMPLDVALNADDLWAQVQRLPDAFLALPGEGRPPAIRVILITVSAAAFIPVGMLLVLVESETRRGRRGLTAEILTGLALNAAIFAVSTLVMGASPRLASILYRTAGVAVGAEMLHWLQRQDILWIRRKLSRVVGWTVLPYLLAVLLVNRLLSVHWLTLQQAVAQFYPLGVLPLFDYYIVSKAAAAKNIVGHVLLYMPIGAGLWLRDGRQRVGQAFCLAALLSLAVETARYFRPGLQGDINAVAAAGLSAALTMRLMPWVWSMLATLTAQPGRAAMRHANDPEPATPPDAMRLSASGRIEEY
jgi:VanZ family protein